MLSTRELQEQDIDHLVQYWLHSDPYYMIGMGVDLEKLPSEENLRNFLGQQITLPNNQKASYCIIWEEEGKAIGHCNVNKIKYGEEAYMHLHLWQLKRRSKGLGTTLIKRTLPYFFQELELGTLFCEPYAPNQSPNKTLRGIGFEFIKTHVTIPGSLNFEQEVNRWSLRRTQFEELSKNW